MLSLTRFARNVVGALIPAYSRIEIVESSPTRLVLDINGRMIIADGGARKIWSNGELLAQFDAIDHLDIQHFPRPKSGDFWRIRLVLVNGRVERIGLACDDMQAARAAAHLGTVTGKAVRRVSLTGI